EEIDRILFSILTAVTSGSGLGFNRAMLFTYNEELGEIAGKMAVGPDSFEEAIQIWGAVQNENVDMVTRVSSYKVTSGIRGGRFYSDVVASRFPISSDNILVKCMTELHPKHVYDSWNDPEVDAEFKKFIDVREFVAVPLVAGNKALGVIVADNRFNNTPISHENIELLSIFAMQAAFSMESFTHLSSLKEQMEKIKSRQSAIVESEKMAAVGRIAAHIAHEIRNPLATMGLYAKRILQTIAKGQKNIDSIKHGADVIKLEVERLEKILSNVMDFTRLDTYIKEYHSINDVADDTYNLLKNLFQERKITADIRLAEDLPLVKSDFNQLKQVMLNLIQNAMDASGENGLVQIETGLKDSKVFFAVKDTGKGIAPENLSKLFEPFFTTKTNGVGLGLAVCKKIVTDHGGEITAQNREHGGAEFIVEFPVA
nr:GAF domain-containing protein [Spirochaetota bacterium]